MSRRAEDDLAAAACRALVQGQTAEAKRLAVQFLAAESQRAADRRAQNANRQRRFKRESNAVGNAETALANAKTALPEALLPALPAPLLPRAPSSPDQKEAAAAPKDLKAKTRGYIVPLTVETVAAEWHQAMHGPGGNPNGLHAAGPWRSEYETMAAAISALPEDTRLTALRALCAWIWRAPGGPVAGKRVDRYAMDPGYVAKRISTDLRAAEAWFSSQNGEAAE